jgi:ComF family protein
MPSVRQVTDAVLAALLAPPCASCGRVLDRPLAGAVCHDCWSSLAGRPGLVGPVSSRISRGTAIGEYEGTLRAIIHALKYDGRRSVASGLSRALADCGSEVLSGADAVVPVPLHRRRERERGFNQAHDLALGLGLPVWRALHRLRYTQPQVDLPAEQRLQNVRDAFAVAVPSFGWLNRAPHRLPHAVVVLVDDVMTTGATLDACARALLNAGVGEVRALTAARVGSGRR